MHRVYLSPSNQEHNAGKAGYNEERAMHDLAGRVAKVLKERGFSVRISDPAWDMAKVCADSNAFGALAHVCIHSNAGGGDGTVGFYGSALGKKLTTSIYEHVAPLSPGRDEGVRSWPGLYEIAHTNAPVAYLELFFHDSYAEVADYERHKDEYAAAIAEGICDWFGVSTKPAVDYRPIKRQAVRLAKLLGIPCDEVDPETNVLGKAARALLLAIARHRE